MQTRSAKRRSSQLQAVLSSEHSRSDREDALTRSSPDEQEYVLAAGPNSSAYSYFTKDRDATLQDPSEWSSIPFSIPEHKTGLPPSSALLHHGPYGNVESPDVTYEAPSRGHAPVYSDSLASASFETADYDENLIERPPYMTRTQGERQTEFEHDHAVQARVYPAKKRRVGAKGERFAKDFTASKATLKFKSILTARQQVQARTPLGIAEDDFVEVEAQHQTYVKRMLMAFDEKELELPPEDRERTEEELRYFRNWQTDQHNAVITKIRDKSNTASFVEERCWDVYLAAIDMHRYGAPVGSEDRSRMLQCPCSVRIETIIDAMRGFTIVRLDILRRDRIEQLVHNPLTFVERKLANVWVNQKKQMKGRTNASRSTKRRRTANALDAEDSYE